MKSGFPAPGHNHSRCVEDALTRAEEACDRSGRRLTPLRRRVLEALAESHSPIGAYDIVERLKQSREAAPAMSVYRALDFLVSEGLAHRIESRNAFLACNRGHDSDEVVVFLLCERCGTVAEVKSDAVGRDLARAAGAVGFEARVPVLEIKGLCESCRAEAR
ncbi:MAG TPA: Fur family transcriptional regulator [Xanthobacteraceae bacterium]|jgi:Fur family zinc uptake transcriptional regulator